eukprot:SAG22_NODE_693_length_7872_cov_13.111797_8_plen_433_part_00
MPAMKIFTVLALMGNGAASNGHGCLISGTCDNTAANCSPAACVTAGGTWVTASAASPCADADSCADAAMAPGVAAGLTVVAQAGAFGAASGDDFAAKMVARSAAYRATDVDATSFKARVQALGATACGSSTCGADLDTYIEALLAGTTVTGDNSGWSQHDDGRDEAIKKAIFNQALSYMVMGAAKDAVTGSDAAGWNTAWAMYGWLGAANAGSTPYATANKRCKNYGTCSTTFTAGSSGEAEANVAISAAFGTMISANYDIIEANIIVTYVQATLRYANKIDKDVTACPATEHREHQGEGQSFGARLIQNIPGLTLSSDINTALANVYMETPCGSGTDGPCEGPGGRYCTLLPLLQAVVPAGATLGTMQASESPRTCPDPQASFDANRCTSLAAAAAAAAAAATDAAKVSAGSTATACMATIVGVLAVGAGF